ncbi:hypothetical protein DPMN_018957 [Dreissena polymorpha]|uniref:Uncharacterized protein n=1 Tax=Dreissena polymorpha TaxID=45954 RepID=A0A9D4NE55_DREPO|nr:hypothetical protein DPMN_018957 [Dreissena polymorpha]
MQPRAGHSGLPRRNATWSWPLGTTSEECNLELATRDYLGDPLDAAALDIYTCSLQRLLIMVDLISHRLIRDDTFRPNWILAKKRLSLNEKYHKSGDCRP